MIETGLMTRIGMVTRANMSTKRFAGRLQVLFGLGVVSRTSSSRAELDMSVYFGNLPWL
jgi:hypothetical protein